MSGGSSRRGFLRELSSVAREARGAVGAVQRDALSHADAEAALLAGAADEEAVAQRPAGTLSSQELDRYSRHLVLPEFSEAAQLTLRASSVLVVGAGALGSPVAMYLAGAGVGRLGIVDADRVELSNLHRQLLHFTPDVGVPKAHSAQVKLNFLNPEVEIIPYEVRLDPGNVAGLLEGHDLVVDCSDSFQTRYAINAACCAAGLALVEGAVVGLGGMVMSIRPGGSACYRCAFPAPPPPGAQATCAQAGVLGPAAGVVGSLQALEALKLLSGFAPPLLDAFVQVELAEVSLTTVRTSRRPDCPDCATE